MDEERLREIEAFTNAPEGDQEYGRYIRRDVPDMIAEIRRLQRDIRGLLREIEELRVRPPIEPWCVSRAFHRSGDWIVHQPGPNRPEKIAYFKEEQEAREYADRLNREGLVAELSRKIDEIRAFRHCIKERDARLAGLQASYERLLKEVAYLQHDRDFYRKDNERLNRELKTALGRITELKDKQGR